MTLQEKYFSLPYPLRALRGMSWSSDNLQGEILCNVRLPYDAKVSGLTFSFGGPKEIKM